MLSLISNLVNVGTKIFVKQISLYFVAKNCQMTFVLNIFVNWNCECKGKNQVAFKCSRCKEHFIVIIR